MTEVISEFMEKRFKDADGQPVNPGNMGDAKHFAQDLGSFLFALHQLPTETASQPDFSNNFAGSNLDLFEAEFDETLKKYSKLVPVEFLHEKFEKASKTAWSKAPVWVLGNFRPEHILVAAGKLTQVKTAEKLAAGDPACDLAVAWLLFDAKARKIFFSAAGADAATVDRARLYAIRLSLSMYNSADIDELIQSRDALTEILKDYGYSGSVDSYDSGISAREEDVDFQPGGLFGKQ